MHFSIDVLLSNWRPGSWLAIGWPAHCAPLHASELLSRAAVELASCSVAQGMARCEFRLGSLPSGASTAIGGSPGAPDYSFLGARTAGFSVKIQTSCADSATYQPLVSCSPEPPPEPFPPQRPIPPLPPPPPPPTPRPPLVSQAVAKQKDVTAATPAVQQPALMSRGAPASAAAAPNWRPESVGDLYTTGSTAVAKTTIHVASTHMLGSQGALGSWRGDTSVDMTARPAEIEELQSVQASHGNTAEDDHTAISELTRLLSWGGLLAGLLLMWLCVHCLGTHRGRARRERDRDLERHELATCIAPSRREGEKQEVQDLQQEYTNKLRARIACYAEQQIDALAAASIATSSREHLDSARFRDDDDDFYERTILLPASARAARAPGVVRPLSTDCRRRLGSRPHDALDEWDFVNLLMMMT